MRGSNGNSCPRSATLCVYRCALLANSCSHAPWAGPRGCKMERGQKRKSTVSAQVLRDLLHTGSVSTAGLTAILRKLQGADLSQAPTQHELKCENRVAFSELRHVEELPLESGGTFRWELMHPCRLLAKMVEMPTRFGRNLEEAYRLSPCSPTKPWRLVIAFDEFCPGACHYRADICIYIYIFTEARCNRLLL